MVYEPQSSAKPSAESQATIDPVVESLVGMLPRHLDEIKRQEPLRQGIAALILGGAAALAIFVDATVAILFSVFAIAAVWMVPPLRRTIAGQQFGLKDANGRYRIVANGGDAATLPLLGVYDDDGSARLVMGLGETGDPIVSLLAADQQPLVVLWGRAETPGLFVRDATSGRLEIELMGSNPNGTRRPHLALYGVDDSISLIEPATTVCGNQDNTIGLTAADGTSRLSCSSPAGFTAMVGADSEKAFATLQNAEKTLLAYGSAGAEQTMLGVSDSEGRDGVSAGLRHTPKITAATLGVSCSGHQAKLVANPDGPPVVSVDGARQVLRPPPHEGGAPDPDSGE